MRNGRTAITCGSGSLVPKEQDVLSGLDPIGDLPIWQRLRVFEVIKLTDVARELMRIDALLQISGKLGSRRESTAICDITEGRNAG